MGSAIIQNRNLVPSENGIKYSRQSITHGLKRRELESSIIKKKKAQVMLTPAIPITKKAYLAVTGMLYCLSMQIGSLFSLAKRRSKMMNGS